MDYPRVNTFLINGYTYTLPNINNISIGLAYKEVER